MTTTLLTHDEHFRGAVMFTWRRRWHVWQLPTMHRHGC